MRISGIIAEYNPFHNGHRLHLTETCAQSGCDAIIAVMSGNFVQRGEPAAFDKWTRTKIALQCGVDAVFELPAFYALQSADWFAFGGVAVLDGLGVDCLSFGTELPDLARLTRLAEIYDDEPEEVKAAIKAAMKQGKPHPKARAEVLAAWFCDAETSDALSAPNSVLGAMYLKQLRNLNSPIKPIAIQRVEAGYNDEQIHGNIASATAVRKSLAEGGDGWRTAIPGAVAAIVDGESERGAGPIISNDFSSILLYALRTGQPLPDAAEGLDNRMRKAAFSCGSIEEFYAAVKSKRYTMARIKRASMQAMLGITTDDISTIRAERPIYARLLGYSRRVDGLINELACRSKIPFVVRTSDFEPQSQAMARLWQIDHTASDIYTLASKNPAMRQGKRDYTEKLIVID